MSVGDSTSTSQDPASSGDDDGPGAAHGSTEGTARNQDEAGLYGSRPGLNMVAAATAELVGAFLLVLASAVFISVPPTGAGVNPARALGPMLVSGQLTDWWAYLIGPVLGALVAAVLHDRFLSRAQSPA